MYPALEPSAQGGHGPIVVDPEEASKLPDVWEHLSYEDRLGVLGLFGLQEEKRWLQGDLCSLLLLERILKNDF